MDDSPPDHLKSIFECARLGWNLKLTCWRCGNVRVLHAAAVWLRLSLKGRPDALIEVKRYGKCMPCLTDRHEIIRGPAVELVRDPPTGDPLPLPTDRQWKEGLRWQRR